MISWAMNQEKHDFIIRTIMTSFFVSFHNGKDSRMDEMFIAILGETTQNSGSSVDSDGYED